jgi:pimeloyl-ACP methyl ester carboxylesterase
VASVVDAFVTGLDADKDWVLVPHSNAGLFAPAVARSRRVSGVVYVDARLPETGVQPMKLPPALAFLADKADSSGLLPSWNLWWGEDIGELFPTRAMQRACESEMRRLPLSYFEDHIDGTGWDEIPSAYLAFGEAYADERNRAAVDGWPSVTLEEAGHLQMLLDPVGVASQIDSLARLVSTTGGYGDGLR